MIMSLALQSEGSLKLLSACTRISLAMRAIADVMEGRVSELGGKILRLGTSSLSWLALFANLSLLATFTGQAQTFFMH